MYLKKGQCKIVLFWLYFAKKGFYLSSGISTLSAINICSIILSRSSRNHKGIENTINHSNLMDIIYCEANILIIFLIWVTYINVRLMIIKQSNYVHTFMTSRLVFGELITYRFNRTAPNETERTVHLLGQQFPNLFMTHIYHPQYFFGIFN